GAGETSEEIGEFGGVNVATLECPVADMDTVGEQVDRLRDRLKSGVVLVAGSEGGKVLLAIGVTADLTNRFKAGALMKEVAAVVGGSGGGRPDFARGQGKKSENLEQAFQKLRDLVGGL
ncbi:MAG: DHHA1 domain-containing protein, partial [Planctomycetota bacterium]